MNVDLKQFMADPFNGEGTLVSDSPYLRTWLGEDADGRIVKCDVSYTGPILDANKEQMNNAGNKRFGDGQVVARIPLDIFYGDYTKARKNGDIGWIKRFLNDPDNEKMRTFRGTI